MHTTIALPIAPFKGAVQIAVRSLQMQIILLEANGYSSQREEYIRAMKALAIFLQKLVNNTDEAFCEVVRDNCEQVVHENAATRDGVIDLATKSSDPDIEKFARAAEEIHARIVKDLGESETKIVRSISEEFSELGKEVDKILSEINNLRVR